MARKPRQELTQERLKELLHYDPETGVFTRRVSWYGLKAGSIPGCLMTLGYIAIGIDGKAYFAHRLAWLYVHGVFPQTIDHINRVKTDNRLCNLRNGTQADNARNMSVQQRSVSGHAGVSRRANEDGSVIKWRARIMLNYEEHYLGLFNTIDDAVAARTAAKIKFHVKEGEPT